MEEEVDEPDSIQVIVLGSGGGPREDNTTGFLVRSTATDWQPGSILAVDAGTHLVTITRILMQPAQKWFTAPKPPQDLTFHKLLSGPFSGLKFFTSDDKRDIQKVAIAVVLQRLILNYVITHPHLDHISGFVINTAAFSPAFPKKCLIGLPSTIEAFKNHVFNNVLWPNLSNENNGAGLITYKRLLDSSCLAQSSKQTEIEHSTGLWGQGTHDEEASSNKCDEKQDDGYVTACNGLSVKAWSISHGHCVENHSHRGSISGPSHSSEDSLPKGQGQESDLCVYDSTAYFIRDDATKNEVLMFGDVEPDSISLSPRNIEVWKEAAPKIASRILRTIFIECSYDNSRAADKLYGHLSPRFLLEELKVLANEVMIVKDGTSHHCGSQTGEEHLTTHEEKEDTSDTLPTASSTKSDPHQGLVLNNPPTAQKVHRGHPLTGVKIVLIHIKEALDGLPDKGDIILAEVNQLHEENPIGCTFSLAAQGQSIYV